MTLLLEKEYSQIVTFLPDDTAVEGLSTCSGLNSSGETSSSSIGWQPFCQGLLAVYSFRRI